MKNISGEVMITAVACIMFIISITMFMGQLKDVDDLAEAVARSHEENTEGAYLSWEGYGQPEVTYEQVVAQVMTDTLPYYVVIDGMIYRPDAYTDHFLSDGLPVRHDRYTKELYYNEAGVLVGVVYTGID